jgi:hypothetical protein
MATLTAEAPAVASSETKQPAKNRERARRRWGVSAVESGARYFLVKSSGPDRMEFIEEASSESEAMVTAFRSGGSFAVVTEWKTVADLSSTQPVIKKEAVSKPKK